MAHIIKCRAQLDPTFCYDGQPTSRQFGEDLPMNEDNTYEYDGETGTGSIVCDWCYSELIPFSMSGAALAAELPSAIDEYRFIVRTVEDHPNPVEILQHAEQAIADSSPHTPMHRSARATCEIVKRVVERKQREGS